MFFIRRFFFQVVFTLSFLASQLFLHDAKADIGKQAVSLNEAIGEIEGFRETHGHPPSIDDFFSLIQRIRQDGMDMGSLTFDNYGVLQKKILECQSPAITTNQLCKIFQSKRDSLDNYHLKYATKSTSLAKGGNSEILYWVEREFAKSGGKVLIKSRDLVSGKKQSNTIVFDGINMVHLREAAGDMPQAGISSSDHNLAGYFLDSNMPVTRAGLFDTKLYGFPHPTLDMIMFLEGDDGRGKPYYPPITFEKGEVINGSSCILVANGNHSAFLDVDKDYSLVRFEEYAPKISQNSAGVTVLVGRYIVFRATLHDLRSYGNGIWLPQEILSEGYDHEGRLILRDSVLVTDVHVNTDLPDSFFTDIIPSNALVSDGKNQMTYRYNDRASINALLKETAKSKRVWIFQYISMTVGIVLILIWIIIKYRKYRASM